MDDIRALFLGVAGGVLGAFFKFWIEDLRNWQRNRLNERELELLRLMGSERGLARFVVKKGCPPRFENQMEDIDKPELNFKFDDRGEIAKLLDL